MHLPRQSCSSQQCDDIQATTWGSGLWRLALSWMVSGGAVKKVNEDGLSVTKAEDFARWYSEVVVKSEMIEYYDVSGTLTPGCCAPRWSWQLQPSGSAPHETLRPQS